MLRFKGGFLAGWNFPGLIHEHAVGFCRDSCMNVAHSGAQLPVASLLLSNQPTLTMSSHGQFCHMLSLDPAQL